MIFRSDQGYISLEYRKQKKKGKKKERTCCWTSRGREKRPPASGSRDQLQNNLKLLIQANTHNSSRDGSKKGARIKQQEAKGEKNHGYERTSQVPN